MATRNIKGKTAKTGKAATKRGRGKLAPGAKARGLEAAEVSIALDDEGIAETVALVRGAGGAYSSFLKKVDRFSERALGHSLRERDGYAARLLEIDSQVKRIIEALQARGFKSPYLRNYVAARINPVRFHKAKKGDAKPPMPLAQAQARAQALTRMAAAAKNFNVESVSNRDLAWVAMGAGD